MVPEKLAVLLAQAREKSQPAVNTLVDLFQEALVRMVRRRLHPGLRCRLDPEELAHEVFTKFFTKTLYSEACPVAAALRAYLMGAATKKVLEANRKHRDTAKRAVDREGPLPAGLLQRGPSPEEASDFRDELDHDLQMLPPRERQTVILLLDGATRAEVAASVGTTVRTVWNIIDGLWRRHALSAIS